MAEVADTGEDEFLEDDDASVMMNKETEGNSPNLCLGDFLWRSDPFNFVARLFNGVHQAPDVAGDIVQQVNSGHLARYIMSRRGEMREEGWG